jgi:hypothetical protein
LDLPTTLLILLYNNFEHKSRKQNDFIPGNLRFAPEYQGRFSFPKKREPSPCSYFQRLAFPPAVGKPLSKLNAKTKDAPLPLTMYQQKLLPYSGKMSLPALAGNIDKHTVII